MSFCYISHLQYIFHINVWCSILRVIFYTPCFITFVQNSSNILVVCVLNMHVCRYPWLFTCICNSMYAYVSGCHLSNFCALESWNKDITWESHAILLFWRDILSGQNMFQSFRGYLWFFIYLLFGWVLCGLKAYLIINLTVHDFLKSVSEENEKIKVWKLESTRRWQKFENEGV